MPGVQIDRSVGDTDGARRDPSPWPAAPTRMSDRLGAIGGMGARHGFTFGHGRMIVGRPGRAGEGVLASRRSALRRE